MGAATHAMRLFGDAALAGCSTGEPLSAAEAPRPGGIDSVVARDFLREAARSPRSESRIKGALAVRRLAKESLNGIELIDVPASSPVRARIHVRALRIGGIRKLVRRSSADVRRESGHVDMELTLRGGTDVSCRSARIFTNVPSAPLSSSTPDGYERHIVGAAAGLSGWSVVAWPAREYGGHGLDLVRWLLIGEY